MLIDDIHNLDCSRKDGKLANDHLKDLANYIPATFICACINVRSTSLFSEGGSSRLTQTSGRFSVLPIQPFGKHVLTPPDRPSKRLAAEVERERTEWRQLVGAMDAALRLYHHEPGSLLEMSDYLLERTDGVIGALATLIRRGAKVAITKHERDAGYKERLTKVLLDRISTDEVSEFRESTRRKAAQRRRA